jgi:hypothetical protein
LTESIIQNTRLTGRKSFCLPVEEKTNRAPASVSSRALSKIAEYVLVTVSENDEFQSSQLSTLPETFIADTSGVTLSGVEVFGALNLTFRGSTGGSTGNDGGAGGADSATVAALSC